MTCIVAIKTRGNKVVMAGDSFCGNAIQDLCAEPKVYAVGSMGVGVCGEIRSEQVLGQTLRNLVAGWTLNDKGAWTSSLGVDPEPIEITHDWIRNEMPDALRLAMKRRGTLWDKEGRHNMVSSAYLICFDGEIYQFDADFGIWQSQRPYAAIGFAHDLAKGAVYASLPEHAGLPGPETAEVVAVVALEAASAWSAYACPPFTTIEV